jgi:hypothetical protein
VAGVRTVLLRLTSPGPKTPVVELNWLAQDTQGNVHMLKKQNLNDRNGRRYRAELVGVAAHRVWFVLPRASTLRKGRSWYCYTAERALRRYQVLSMSATLRGRSGLMQIQDVGDTNADGKFDPTWSGPDYRSDHFWGRGGYGVYGGVYAANGSTGFARQ